MWLNQDFTCTFTHICYFYFGSTIHIYPSIPSPEPRENILLLIQERITKNISVSPCEVNALVILLLPLAILSQEMNALKKRRKKEAEIIRGNKKEQVLGTSKGEKRVRREVKMDKCSTVELGVQDTHLREKKKEEHLILLIKFQKQGRYVSP